MDRRTRNVQGVQDSELYPTVQSCSGTNKLRCPAQSIRQRTENPMLLLTLTRRTPAYLLPISRFQASNSPEDVDDQKNASLPCAKNPPRQLRLPAGSALNPLPPPVAEPAATSREDAFFSALPATVSPPSASTSLSHSPSVGTCHPAGASPLGSLTANQL